MEQLPTAPGWSCPSLMPSTPSAQTLHTLVFVTTHLLRFGAFVPRAKGELTQTRLCSAFFCPDTHGQGRPSAGSTAALIPGAPPLLHTETLGGGGGGSENAPALSRHSAAAQGEPEPSSRHHHHHHSRGTLEVSPGMRPECRMENPAGPCPQKRTRLARRGAAPLRRAEAAGQPQMAPVSRAGAAPPLRHRPRGLSQSQVTTAAAGREAANQRGGRGPRPCGRRRHVGRGRDRAVTRGRDKGAARAFPRRRLKGTARAPRRRSDPRRCGPCVPWVCRGAASASCPGHEPAHPPVRTAQQAGTDGIASAGCPAVTVPCPEPGTAGRTDRQTDGQLGLCLLWPGRTDSQAHRQDRQTGFACIHRAGQMDRRALPEYSRKDGQTARAQARQDRQTGKQGWAMKSSHSLCRPSLPCPCP